MSTRREHPMPVGYYGDGYVEERLITSLPFRNARLVRKRDLFNALTFVLRRLHRPAPARALVNCLHHDVGFPGVPLIHLVNTISLSHTPWIVSYEHYIPRWDWHSPLGWRRLAAPSCRRIIAISRWAHRFQEHLLTRHAELESAVRPKMSVLQPSQPPLITDYEEKRLRQDRITFALVGGDFFRKGGLEVLEVFALLTEEGLPIHLTIVSPLTYGDYASKTTAEHLARAQHLMARMGSSVTHIPSMSNDRVLDLLRTIHVGLLPTYDDTYGFFVLEAQAAGCPVITTDGCALPEFNNDQRGWLIEVPKDEHGVQRHRTAEERQVLSATIREHLMRIVRGICDDPGSVAAKGRLALEQIRRHHSPEESVTVLESYYTEALS